MNYRIGMVLDGKVTGIQPYGAFVALDDKTQGLIHISECRHGFIDDIHSYLKIGQRVRVMIIDIDEYTQKISLSVRCLEKPFDFEAPNRSRSTRKRFWTNRHVHDGFAPIASRLDGWVESALEDIENGK
ncbi:general stress protein 13 [Ligilactobacillus sp. WC1T17]|uniref:General stress protein 13 n=1 Tax=Ligilactobacillus ruminis TaxID=1623 RepID=A0ABY1AE17_9LACO|nr:general stress protein 13 [Ligilactobacillus ruminis]